MRSIRESYNNVFELGNKSDWRGQNWVNGIPWVNAIKAGIGSEDPDVQAYQSALGRVTSKEFHELYGSVLSQGELAKARSFMAENWNSPEVARTRLKSAMAELDLQIKGLQEASGKLEPPKEDKWWEKYATK